MFPLSRTCPPHPLLPRVLSSTSYPAFLASELVFLHPPLHLVLHLYLTYSYFNFVPFYQLSPIISFYIFFQSLLFVQIFYYVLFIILSLLIIFLFLFLLLLLLLLLLFLLLLLLQF